MSNIAVLTGDLIASTLAEPQAVNVAMNRIASIADKLGPETRFTRFRGDGWQMYLRDPGWCLWVPLWLLATLRADHNGLLTRIGIGLGEADALGKAPRLDEAVGSAFIASGRALDTMRPGQVLALAGEGTDEIQRCLVEFAEDRAKGWSTEQAQALYWAFANQTGDVRTQGEIASKLNITRQAVGARLQSAGYSLLHNAEQAFYNRHHHANIAA